MQIAQMPQASVLGFSWHAEQSKPVKGWSPQTSLCQGLCSTALSPALRLSSQAAPHRQPPLCKQTSKKSQRKLKKKPNKLFQILRVLYFISYRPPALWACPFPEEWQGTRHSLEKPFPVGHLSPHSIPFLLSPWTTEAHLKLFINNIACLTQKGRERALS